MKIFWNFRIVGRQGCLTTKEVVDNEFHKGNGHGAGLIPFDNDLEKRAQHGDFCSGFHLRQSC